MRQSHIAFLESEGSHYTLDRFTVVPVLQTGSAVRASEREKIVIPESSSLSVFPYGPSSGGMVESVYFDILTQGEKIQKVGYDAGFKNRSIKLSGLTKNEALLRIERMNGVHCAAYSSMFCDICESGINMEIPDQVKYLRVAMMEAERISSHLFVASRLTGGASQNIAHMNILLLREELLRTISAAFGHRYFFGVNRIGGVNRPVDLNGFAKKIRHITDEYNEIFRTLMDSRVFIDRLDRSAIIRGENSSGPALRGSGMKKDGRNFHKYYEELEFRTITSDGGDALARFLVRSGEIQESAGIIEQAISRAADPYANSQVNEGNNSFMAGGFMETPSGDASMIVKMGNGRVESIGFRSPSILNMEAFLEAISGNTFADFLFGYESLGIWICEMGDFQ